MASSDPFDLFKDKCVVFEVIFYPTQTICVRNRNEVRMESPDAKINGTKIVLILDMAVVADLRTHQHMWAVRYPCRTIEPSLLNCQAYHYPRCGHPLYALPHTPEYGFKTCDQWSLASSHERAAVGASFAGKLN